ncbi:MAG: glycine cleavage system protein GcvH [Nannocystaceae bacterium]
MSDAVPSNLRYTRDHEWARGEDDGTVTIGITAHAVDQLGDITMLTLPEPGSKLETGESFGDVDSVKAVSELFAPLAGEVTSTNDQLDASPELVNAAPYGAGWLVTLRPTDRDSLSNLMDAIAYEKLLAETE